MTRFQGNVLEFSLCIKNEMRQANIDWQLNMYGGAVHAFTDWNAGNDNSKGVAYNQKADKRSWEAMKVFFAEIFGAGAK